MCRTAKLNVRKSAIEFLIKVDTGAEKKLIKSKKNRGQKKRLGQEANRNNGKNRPHKPLFAPFWRFFVLKSPKQHYTYTLYTQYKNTYTLIQTQ